MINRLLEWDQELLLYLNGKHASWIDPLMLFISTNSCWVLGCLLMLGFIHFKQKCRKSAGLFFLLTVGTSALITNIIKRIIERPRPINDVWSELVRSVANPDDSYSFFSSHSATTFSMAMFFFLIIYSNKSHRPYGYLALVWATLVAYSRIYLGMHYPLDVVVGILFGVTIGIIGYNSYLYFCRKRTSKN